MADENRIAKNLLMKNAFSTRQEQLDGHVQPMQVRLCRNPETKMGQEMKGMRRERYWKESLRSLTDYSEGYFTNPLDRRKTVTRFNQSLGYWFEIVAVVPSSFVK
jgi:hypothetical protein